MYMEDYGRRLVLDMPFELGVAATVDALRSEGFHAVALINVRDEVRRALNHDFRRYLLLIVSTPQSMFDALKEDLAAGTVLPITIAIYELADGETAVVAAAPFESLSENHAWCEACPALAKLAAGETERLARTLAELSHRATSAFSEVDRDVAVGSTAATS